MKRRIDSKTSRTAEFTCTARCISYLEKRPLYHTGDYVSLEIMNSLVKLLLHFPPFVRSFLKCTPEGMYEYVIARTRYFDEAFQRALTDGTEQILILGAGFDSRGIRFAADTSRARVFELDSPTTQTAKKKRYLQKHIPIPKNLTFVSVDFDKQRMEDRLLACGFLQNKTTLVLMEGLTMYLQPVSVEALLTTLHSLLGNGSMIAFDFIDAALVSQNVIIEAESALVSSVERSGEAFHFGLTPTQAAPFLLNAGFFLTDLSNADQLKERFFRDESCSGAVRINPTHHLATARLDRQSPT
ncbi:MAG: SAM-dependent methyltransferase [Clostridiaceae bacterium]